MSNKEAKFWELLGVKPHEKFRLKNCKRITTTVYYFDHFANLHAVKGMTTMGLYDILSGRETIVKVVEMTDDEKLALKYLKKCGYDWIGKDKNGEITAFNLQPVKAGKEWAIFTNWTGAKTLKVEIDLSFLSWEDEYAYKIEEVE